MQIANPIEQSQNLFQTVCSRHSAIKNRSSALEKCTIYECLETKKSLKKVISRRVGVGELALKKGPGISFQKNTKEHAGSVHFLLRQHTDNWALKSL